MRSTSRTTCSPGTPARVWVTCLLQRLTDDMRRDQLRAAQERDIWHAVEHGIISTLQSLMVLHGRDDPGHRDQGFFVARAPT